MKKMYLVYWNNKSVTPCNSLKEVEWLKEHYSKVCFKKIETYELDEAPFDMYSEGIKKTWAYCGVERF